MDESIRKSRITAKLLDSLPKEDQHRVVAFLQELELTDDPQSVLEKHCRANPKLVAMFEFLAQADKSIREVIAESNETQDFVPTSLDSSLADRLQDLDDFKIIRLIKAGGMGLVYEAIQLSINRRVAIKFRCGQISHGEFERFRAEQQILARLDQKNIVPLYVDGRLGDIQYFAMKFIDGVALDELVHALRRMDTVDSLNSAVRYAMQCRPSSQAIQDSQQLETTDESVLAQQGDEGNAKPISRLARSYYRSIADCVVQIATAIQFAHEANVLHRDLKPSNVMIDANGHVWIIDFGLAHTDNRAAHDGQKHQEQDDVVGTPRYMAPEQFAGRASVVSDVWGIGTILYELLALRPPFKGRERTQIVPLEKLFSRTPQDLSAICQKALALDPHARYKSSEALAVDVRRWLDHQPITARRTSVLERVNKWRVRHPVWAAASTVAIAGMIAIEGFNLSYRQELNRALIQTTIARNDESFHRQDAERRALEVARYKRALLRQTATRLMNIGRSGQALKLLKDYVADGQVNRDDLADRVLLNRLRRASWIGKLQDGYVSCLALDVPRGSVITGDSRGVLRALDCTTGSTIFAVPAHRGMISGVALTSDGAAIVTAGEDGFLKIWENDGRVIRTVECHIDSIRSFDMNAQSTLAVTGGRDGVATFTNIAEGKVVHKNQFSGTARKQIKFSPSDDQLVIATETGIEIWRTEPSSSSPFSLEHVGPLSIPTEQRSLPVTCASIGKDGEHLLTAHSDGTLRIWDLSTTELLDQFDSSMAGRIQCVAFDRNESPLIVGGADGTIGFLNQLRNRQSQFYGHSAPIVALATNHEGLLVSASSDGELRCWNSGPRKTRVDVQAHHLNLTDLQFSSDGTRLVTASFDQSAALLDTSNGSILHTLGSHQRTFHPSPNGRLGTILSIRTYQGHGGILNSCCFAPSGKIVATGGIDNAARIWNVESGAQVGVLEHPSAVTAVSFDPKNGERLSTACWDDWVRIWDLRSHSVVLQFKASESWHIGDLEISPDGRFLATAHDDGKISIWDASSGQSIWQWSGHKGSVACVAFEPFGERLVSGGADRTVRIWNRTDGNEWQLLQEFVGHTDTVSSVTFIANHNNLVVSTSRGSNDDTVRVWDIDIGLETLILDGHTTVAASPDGHQLAFGANGRTGLVALIDLATRLPPSPTVTIDAVESIRDSVPDLRILGSFRTKQLDGRDKRYEAKDHHMWLGVVLSLPNSCLMLTHDEFQTWRLAMQRAGRVPIDNPRRLKVFSPSSFVLEASDGKATSAGLVSANWPTVDFGSQRISQTRTIDFVPEERQMIVCVFEVPEVEETDGAFVRFKEERVAPIPPSLLEPPAATLVKE